MADNDRIIDALAADENRYLLVRPASGLRGGYEAVNVWNGDIKRRMDDKDKLVKWAKDYLVHSNSFDHVLEVHDAAE